jgi:deoxycytidylate deaminase
MDPLSRKMEGIVRCAIKEASKSNHHQHRMAAVLIKGGNILAISHNSGFLHTEHGCLNRAWRGGTDDATMVVIRVRRNGTLGMARPCALCTQRLVRAGVKEVIYSNSSGELEAMKLSSMYNEVEYLQYHFVGPSYEAT